MEGGVEYDTTAHTRLAYRSRRTLRGYPNTAKTGQIAVDRLVILDRQPAAARILVTLLRDRALRIGVTVCAIAAVLTLGVLPVAHVHELYSGETLVHSHMIDDPVEHAGTLDHGDHHSVRTLEPTFLVQQVQQLDPPVLLSMTVVVSPPETRALSYVDALDAPVIHGPPIRVVSLRAPPA